MKQTKYLLFPLILLASCSSNSSSSIKSNNTSVTESTFNSVTNSNTNTSSASTFISDNTSNDKEKNLLSAGGYVKDKLIDFTQYENTSSYVKVKTAKEFLDALILAKYDYTSSYNESTGQIDQVLNKEGSVHVIEIENDLELGYKTLIKENCDVSIVTDFASKSESLRPYLYIDPFVDTYGVSQIKIENTSNLLIFSKNGSKLTHCGFKLTSDTNVVIRNLAFDELWQWEDTSTTNSSKIGDYDYFGWAYFKISFCEYIWIDHCSFGKSYDGQIDYSNTIYNNSSTAFRAPYGATGENGLHISYCDFHAGEDDKDGYIYKMMSSIEEDYLHGEQKNLLYKKLRDKGCTFEEILYGTALPQKKGFLLGDSGDGNVEYDYNLSLNVSFNFCRFLNFEDRIPKLRGGNAYLYNCVADSLNYYDYRSKLINKGGKFSDSNFKSALVSQGILCGNGGSIKLENSIYRGIESFLKNNDSSSGDKVKGGYNITNCIYQKNSSSSEIKGSSDINNPFTSSSSTLSTDYFSWHTKDGNAPFVPELIDVEDLELSLKEGTFKVGINKILQDDLLKTKY